MRRGIVSIAVVAVTVLWIMLPHAVASAEQRIELIPDERAGWSPSSLFTFARPDYHSERTLRIETTPPGAKLDLFYVRAGFQKRYEKAESTPVTVVLPTRAAAGKRDRVEIRAVADGYRLESVSVPVRSSQNAVMIDLRPLDNTLAAVSHIYFADRASLTFLTKAPAQVRLQKGAEGFTIVLGQTAEDARAAAVLAGVHNPYIAKIESNQLGEDLLVQVKLAPGLDANALGSRSRESRDDARGLNRYTIDFNPSGAASVDRARNALGQLGAGDVSGCSARFDEALRNRLDPTELSRALAPRGEFTDPYVRTALRRLGEVSGGTIHMEDGTSYRASVPLELSAAASQAASAKGFLALLRAWVRTLEAPEQREAALRSLVAPELDPAKFTSALGAADAAERSCRGA